MISEMTVKDKGGNQVDFLCNCKPAESDIYNAKEMAKQECCVYPGTHIKNREWMNRKWKLLLF